MLSKNHPVIIFIDRFGFSVYQDTLANIAKFNFTPDLVGNLDVVNKDQLAKLIDTFIQINKIIPSSLVVVLSDNVAYVKDLVSVVQKTAPVQGLKTDLNIDKEHQDEVQNFLENVPFEEILARVIKVGNANRIVAVNKDLVMTIINAFASKGSVMEAVIPGFMYGQNANFIGGLTADNVRIILENAEILKSGNLLTDQEKMNPSQNLESELKSSPVDTKSDLAYGTKKPRNHRQYVLVGVFILLLIILAVVYFTMGSSQTPSVQKVNSSAGAASAPVPAVTRESATPVPMDLKLVNIKISHAASSLGIAANLKSNLSGMGFQSIVDEISEVSIPEKSSVIFSQSIPADLRNTIIVEVRKVLPGISALENQDPGFTVTILMGKS